MGKATYVIPQDLIEAVKRHAGVRKQSEFVARAIRRELLRLDVELIAAAEAAEGGADPPIEEAFMEDQERDL
ncbi:hypothetical protein H0264_17560 [Nocardia huaxiensis]|uniref:Uncharacterized protein n=1 Tax=Nocardia huaxiensis TaxID=2755382 RepID=A0A7D6ZL26_9NOCA|nr:hypothetical protein [Nocardia huaxiensis]QLY33799.1 hypothetical protein H0264_17560 [Nocardia huaxiensis]